MAQIKTDILSALSQSGSGLQLQSLTSSLVEAEISGARTLTERRVEDANTSISAMGQLTAEIGLFKAGMNRIAEAASRSASATGDAVTLEVTQEAIASDISAVVEVTSLSASQTLTFSFAAGTEHTAEVQTGTLSISAPGWDSARTAEIGANNNTLSGLARSLNGIEGLTASLIDTGDGIALIVKGEHGTQNALDSGSIAALEQTLGLTPSGTAGQSDVDDNPLGVSSSVQAATDARFTVDGVSVTRGTNVIEDLYPGHRVTLNALGTSTLTSSESSASVRDRVNAFLGEVNALKSYLSTATQRGLNGAEPGPLAGDIAAQSALNRMRAITTEPITGFGAQPVYLAELGIQTERDGTLTLDEDRFTEVMQSNPRIAEALFATKFTADTPGLEISGLSFAPPKPGSYALTYDPDAVPPSGMLDGNPLSVSTNAEGHTVLRASSAAGDTAGMRIVLEQNTALNTSVHYGVSLAEQLSDYSESLTSASGILARRETELNESLAQFEAQMDQIEDRAAMLTERYNIQFGRMEAVISNLNKTGEYMQSLMDAWNAD